MLLLLDFHHSDFTVSLVRLMFAGGCINALSCHLSSNHLSLGDAEKEWSIYIADVHLWSAVLETLICHLSLLCRQSITSLYCEQRIIPASNLSWKPRSTLEYDYWSGFRLSKSKQMCFSSFSFLVNQRIQPNVTYVPLYSLFNSSKADEIV